MKRLLCHLAQKHQHPTAPLAKHVSHCRECREFFQQVSELESRLVTGTGEPDPDLCAEIMDSIASKRPVAFPPSKWASISSPAALSVAAVLVISLIGILTFRNFKKPGQIVDVPAEQVDLTATHVPEASREMTLAYALEQQELLQRDALKLRTHLREKLIIFQTDDHLGSQK